MIPAAASFPCSWLQFLRELHFIEAPTSSSAPRGIPSCSSSGNCTSLRRVQGDVGEDGRVLQFLRELHFIEAGRRRSSALRSRMLQFLRELHFIEAPAGCASRRTPPRLQFLRELHFIEAFRSWRSCASGSSCSSSGNCTSLRPLRRGLAGRGRRAAVPPGTALH